MKEGGGWEGAGGGSGLWGHSEKEGCVSMGGGTKRRTEKRVNDILVTIDREGSASRGVLTGVQKWGRGTPDGKWSKKKREPLDGEAKNKRSSLTPESQLMKGNQFGWAK